ncbi:sulfite exporter TauE/SafE family protein [Leptospira kmetyi]|uniref:sulfite exporter TauE/SafE family protein n=1 Tax=Leptospira kmetyi TaxID=408139 RepID=UPI001083F3ED|nr:sulfite exporter TauE/SafE family protein [Leptospira kmetyi]TGK21527.1 sulfite exporter TauE/SafE family protein [Leptospira kmetyi]TGK28454.1 sulfite exporter TauE/SafE family protein [Leptospira kmetyi]
MFFNEIALFITAYASFLLSAICGGGAGLILIPVLGTFLPIQFVPAALSIGTFASSASRLFAFFQKIRFDIVRWFLPPAVAAVWLGAWLIQYVNPLFMEAFIGIFLISNLPILFKKENSSETYKKPKTFYLAIIGFLAGFVSGITGAVGLLFNKFYLRSGMSKEEIVATRAANEILLHLIKLVLYALFGLINGKTILIGSIVALAALASTWSMKKVLNWINEILFRKIGYFAMTISGVLLLSQSAIGFASSNRADVSFVPIQKGAEAKLGWQQASFSLEFTWDEGFEIEQVVPITDLTPERQSNLLNTKRALNAKILILEAVYSFDKNSYEAYFYGDGKLIRKIEFKE